MRTMLLLASLTLPSTANALYTHTASSTTDVIYVGCRSGKTAICDDGVLTEVETDCTLSDDIVINAAAGNDTVTIVRSSITPTCNGSATSITALTYSGHYIDLVGGTGTDTLEGGTGNHVLSGGDDGDSVTIFSDVGWASGDGGTDVVWARPTNNGWEVYGGTHADCVKGPGQTDPDSTPTAFDCGSDTDEYIDEAGFSETACESVVSSCP